MSILDWVELGKLSAERDDLLSNYFYDNGVLASVINSPSSFLVLGRKGAGKTAVFRHLEKNRNSYLEAGDCLIPLSLEDYNWNVHSLLSNENKAPSLAYKQSWRFIILVEALGAITKWHKASEVKIPKRIDRASKLLERLFDEPEPSLYKVIGNKLLSLSKIKLPGAGVDLEEGNLNSLNLDAGEISFDEVKRDETLKHYLSQNIENIITILEAALEESDPNSPRIFICFDRVDEAWDDVSFESSRTVIAGLVSACDSITAQYRGKIRPIVFLREDIFEVLSINDSNKLREDCGELLHWTRESLLNLVLMRLNYFAQAKGFEKVTDLDSLFDKAEMRQRARPSKHLLRRTMMRPRDLISLLGKTIETMREKAEDPFADEVITFEKLSCDSVYDAEPGYSEWLKKEILDEWQVQHPIIRKLFQAIQNHGSTNISHEIFSQELQKIEGEVSKAETLAHLNFLFDNSIIGFKNGSSTEWRYKCFYPSQGFVESPDYRVHEGLVRSLNLTEPREREEKP